MTHVRDANPVEPGPRLRELATFMLAGPPIGMLLIGIVVNDDSSWILGVLLLFSQMMPLCYVFGWPAALASGIAWLLVRRARHAAGASGPWPVSLGTMAIAAVAGAMNAGLFEGSRNGPPSGAATAAYAIHAAVTAGLCCLITYQLWVRPQAENQATTD